MKRKIILILILLLLICGLVSGIVWLATPGVFSQSAEESEEASQPEIQIIRYPVLEGEIVHTYEVDAQVVSGAPEIYITEICIDSITDTNFSMKKNKGDLIECDEILYEYDGKDYTVDFNGLISDIVYEQVEDDKAAVIRLLNYDNLFITADIEMDKIEKINYNTPVTVIFNGNEAEAKIDTIGFEITNETLPVSVTLPEKLYPGTPVKVVFTLEVNEMGTYVPEEAVYSDGEEYYAYIESENEPQRVEITVGQRFSVEEDGNVFNYIEILSGVSKEAVLVVEKVNYSGSLFKGSLDNE